MAAPVRSPRRAQLLAIIGMVLGMVAVVAGGAFVWSRTVADGAGDDQIRLTEPGEFVDPASTNPPRAGTPLPSVELTTADGAAVQLAPDGRPLVVNLWYSTCPPCGRELATFAQVDEELGDQVRFVGVNPFDTAEAMERFAAGRGVRYELLMDPDFAMANDLGVVQFPVTLFVDVDGEIRAQTGALTESELREHVAELLAR